MKLSLFNYHLPKNLIAQQQVKPRDKSRLLVVDKKTKKLTHDFFYNLTKHLTPNDVLIFNNSKVIPARLIMYKETGGKIEIFLLKKVKSNIWQVLVGGKTKPNNNLSSKGNNLQANILKKVKENRYLVKFNHSGKKLESIIEKIGETPLPPYIKTRDSKYIKKNYQTLFAKHKGSVAAPTAGLHFTKNLLSKLKKRGIKIEFITLHVGLGTFAPVKEKIIEKHQIHSEYTVLDKATAKRLNGYKKQGKTIIAVGTTSCRTLESFSNQKGQLKAGSKWVDIYIYPSYKFKFIDSLITNFHLPQSTLLMLVSALAGREFIIDIYNKAIKKKYRFYSFGDGMFIQ